MVKVVQTLFGEKTVITPEEIKKQIDEKDMSKYVKQEDGDYKCRDCNETILAVRIVRPIWNGPFSLSGSRRCSYETVLYCPKCDRKPNFHGSPITPKGNYRNP